ncbi:hypothetical protein CWB66_11515 [Pseudoalteromonas sp. S558]|nr:hypothetical protein CWB66_11515 [Pseudoalteromonas sp. S558]
MFIFKFIFSSQRFSVKTRRIYASIAGLLQVNSTQLALKMADRDRFLILSSGYLDHILSDYISITLSFFSVLKIFRYSQFCTLA